MEREYFDQLRFVLAFFLHSDFSSFFFSGSAFLCTRGTKNGGTSRGQ